MMSRPNRDTLQGTLDLLVLRTLARGPLHGYGIATLILQISEDFLRVEEGSLYPALHRMEEDGWIQADWAHTEAGRRARFYSLTPAGRHQLAAEQERWSQLTHAVGLVLNHA